MSLFFRLKIRHILEKEAHLQHEKSQFVNFAELIFAVQKCSISVKQYFVYFAERAKTRENKFREICSGKICTCENLYP